MRSFRNLMGLFNNSSLGTIDFVTISQATHSCRQSFSDGTGMDAYSDGLVGKSIVAGDKRWRTVAK